MLSSIKHPISLLNRGDNMTKIILFIAIVFISVSYINDPSILQPWKEVGEKSVDILSKAIKKVGQSANTIIRDEFEKDM
jgi:hypothetical protein